MDATYVINTVGITLPGVERKDLKVGKAIALDEKVGDAFAARGFLTKAESVNTITVKSKK